MTSTLRAARWATLVYFILCGTLVGTWLVRIPVIEERAGIGHSTLGTLLVLLGVGAFLGMQVAGRLSDRLGVHRVVPVSAVLASLTVVLPGLAGNLWTLAAALVVFGFCHGCLDASMNAHAVHVEEGYGRPVMSSFHAMFSIGGVIAALAGAALAFVGPAAGMGVVGVVSAVVAVVSARWLLRVDLAHAATAQHADDAAATAARRGTSRRVWILAALAMLVMLTEGAANDWSALHLRDVLGTSAGTAAVAFGSFSATMTVGRLVADRVVQRFGSEAVLRHGAALAAVGALAASFTPWVWLAVVGWGVLGLGLSGCVPQLFSAAGRVDPAMAGTNVSRVAGLGYLGMLAGPAVIGWLTHVVPLNHAFVLLVVLTLIASASAGVLRTRSTAGTGSTADTGTPDPAEHADTTSTPEVTHV